MKGAVANSERQAESVSQAFDGLSRDAVLDVYRCMVRSRRMDDKEIQLKSQSQTFFQISGAGHEAIQVAAGMTLRPGYDWFHPYYRDRALCLQLGVTPLDMFLAAFGAESDLSNAGRQMPSHWGSTALNIVAGSSATATQVLHAVGQAEAGVLYSRLASIPNRDGLFHGDEIVFTSLGEGSTSEGEFWEAINVSCGRHLPVLFLVEDNGYAISVPVEVETAGGDISKIVAAFPGLHVDTVDGTDFFASFRAMRLPQPTFAHVRVPRSFMRASPAHTRTRTQTTRSCTSQRRNARPRRSATRFCGWPRF